MSHRIQIACVTIGASVLLAQGVFAQGSAETRIDFSPAVTAQLDRDFGANEADVLRSVILAALSKEERHDAIPDGLTLKVTVRELLPTHPTMKQQVLATVDYRNFADVLAAGSPSLDPWADARQSIDAFAAKLAATWDKLPKS
jgi:hypothetical protein